MFQPFMVLEYETQKLVIQNCLSFCFGDRDKIVVYVTMFGKKKLEKNVLKFLHFPSSWKKYEKLLGF